MFQFQLGAIGSGAASGQITVYYGFNSSLVRLGAQGVTTQTIALPEFQFQLGAIGRVNKELENADDKRFQFQLGAIGRFSTLGFPFCRISFNSSLVRLGAQIFTKRIKETSVSIPAWCDWEKTGIGFVSSILTVSIPAWCDWELESR